MQAALLDRPGGLICLGEVAALKPGPGELLVRVEASGICHSDLHLARGEWPGASAAMAFPAILGHEVVGRVEQRGPGVEAPAVGERVGVGWLHSVCGRCEHCRDGAENVCLERTITGIAAPGGHAELIRIRADQAVPVPAGLDPAEAAPLFCAGLTVFHACRLAGVAAGQRLAVIGVGGLGHLAIQIGRCLGAEVVAADVSRAKLELARRCGALDVVDASAPEAVARLRAAGPHVAMVTAASRPAYELALAALRRRGTLAVVGLPSEPLRLLADDLATPEHRIVACAVGTRAEQRELLALAAAGRVRCQVERVGLAEVGSTLERLSRGDVLGRAVVVF
jgi:propanol-preferring alcohol dehydrogenase